MSDDAVVRIITFDSSTARHVDAFASDFRLARIGDVRHARLHVAHLSPGEHIGRHAAATDQAFLVVAGEGWASGADDQRVVIQAGHGAVWVQGEQHAAGTETGLTAVVVEGAFEF